MGISTANNHVGGPGIFDLRIVADQITCQIWTKRYEECISPPPGGAYQ
jgi:hypothetical protein